MPSSPSVSPAVACRAIKARATSYGVARPSALRPDARRRGSRDRDNTRKTRDLRPTTSDQRPDYNPRTADHAHAVSATAPHACDNLAQEGAGRGRADCAAVLFRCGAQSASGACGARHRRIVSGGQHPDPPPQSVGIGCRGALRRQGPREGRAGGIRHARVAGSAKQHAADPDGRDHHTAQIGRTRQANAGIAESGPRRPSRAPQRVRTRPVRRNRAGPVRYRAREIARSLDSRSDVEFATPNFITGLRKWSRS